MVLWALTIDAKCLRNYPCQQITQQLCCVCRSQKLQFHSEESTKSGGNWSRIILLSRNCKENYWNNAKMFSLFKININWYEIYHYLFAGVRMKWKPSTLLWLLLLLFGLARWFDLFFFYFVRCYQTSNRSNWATTSCLFRYYYCWCCFPLFLLMSLQFKSPQWTLWENCISQTTRSEQQREKK